MEMGMTISPRPPTHMHNFLHPTPLQNAKLVLADMPPDVFAQMKAALQAAAHGEAVPDGGSAAARVGADAFLPPKPSGCGDDDGDGSAAASNEEGSKEQASVPAPAVKVQDEP